MQLLKITFNTFPSDEVINKLQSTCSNVELFDTTILCEVNSSMDALIVSRGLLNNYHADSVDVYSVNEKQRLIKSRLDF